MKSCCLCFSLAKGGQLTAGLTLFIGVGLLGVGVKHNRTQLCMIFFEIFVAGICLYGIRKKNHKLMLPFVILSWAWLVHDIILVTFIPYDWLGPKLMKKTILEVILEALPDEPYSYFHKTKKLNIDDDKAVRILSKNMDTIYLVFCIESAIFTVIQFYLAWIMHTLYKSIRTEKQTPFAHQSGE